MRNEVKIPDAYTIPRMDDCIDSLDASTVYTLIDENCGYWQLPILEEDRERTPFLSPRGTFRRTRMSFGLRNAPATFQRTFDSTLSCLRLMNSLLYLDDVKIISKSAEDNIKYINELLQLLREAGVSLKLQKCSFFRKPADYLGHVLLPGWLGMAMDSASSIADAEFPREKTKLRSFLGMCNVFWHFIKDFSNLAESLHCWIPKYVKPTWDSPPKSQL